MCASSRRPEHRRRRATKSSTPLRPPKSKAHGEVDVSAGPGPTFHRYLAAKQSLDDRSLNEAVWEAFARALEPSAPDEPLRVLEVGAGVGGMVERLLERVNLDRVRYLAVDSDPTRLPEAARRLQAWAARHDARWGRLAEDRWRVETRSAAVEVHWSTGSLFDDLADPGPFDVALAHAVLDLVDLDRALPRLLGSLRPGGVFYFTLNFDGLTAFLPEIDPSLDRAIVDAYHATMDNRLDGVRPSGDSRTGRRLLTELPRHGADLMAAGASDWIIFPRDGGYAEDDALVLRAILDMVEASLQGSPAVPADRLSWWSARRRQQIADGTLAFIAHQLDVLGRTHRPSA